MSKHKSSLSRILKELFEAIIKLLCVVILF